MATPINGKNLNYIDQLKGKKPLTPLKSRAYYKGTRKRYLPCSF